MKKLLFLLLAGISIAAIRAGAEDLIAITADQITFAMTGCENCTPPQMKSLATRSTSPGNYVFVYSLATNVIRKYRVYLDSTCKYDPLPPGKQRPPGERTESTPKPTCGAYRDAIESAVDSSVQAIFNAMHALSLSAPQLLATGSANWWVGGNGLRHMPPDAATGQPFNLPDAAWEYPQGTGYRFMDQVGQVLQDQTQLRELDPDLAALIYDIWVPSVNVSITISANPSVTAQGTLQLDVEKPVTLKVCDTDGNCAILKITRDRTQIKVALDSVVDRNGNMFPMPQLQKPSSPSWRFPGGTGDRFARTLQNHGVDIVGPGAGGWYTISCGWVGDRLIGCVAE